MTEVDHVLPADAVALCHGPVRDGDDARTLPAATPIQTDVLTETLFRTSPDAIVVTDRDRVIVDTNGAFQGMFDWPAEAVRGQSAAKLFADADDFLRLGDAFFNDRDSGVSDVFHVRYRRREGSIFSGRTVALRLRGPSGAAIGFARIISDVAELDAAEDAIGRSRAEREMQRILYRRAPTMMHSVDRSERLRSVSDAWLERLGYRKSDVIGRPWADFLTPESREKNLEANADFERTGRCDRIGYTVLTGTGSTIEVELTAVADSSIEDVAMLALLEDVTERNATLRKLETANARLRDFAHVAAHDLRAPLRHISLFSELAEDDVKRGTQHGALENLAIVRDCAARLGAMVAGLLDFSVNDRHEIRRSLVSLEDVAERVRDGLLREPGSQDAEITIGPLPRIRCDPLLIERVFENLLGNALKYVAEDVVPRVVVRAERRGNLWHILVSDNGIGIPPQFASRIFQPMRRLHAADGPYPGCGIGLALVRQIVEAHGGRIWVEPDSGGGSRFIFVLEGDRGSGWPVSPEPRTDGRSL